MRWLVLGPLRLAYLLRRNAIRMRSVILSVFPKEWMGLERFGKFQLCPQHVLGFIDIRLSALIAANREAFRQRRKRGHRIGFGEGDPMPEEQILPHVKPAVLAKNNPAIIGVFPHCSTPGPGRDWAGPLRATLRVGRCASQRPYRRLYKEFTPVRQTKRIRYFDCSRSHCTPARKGVRVRKIVSPPAGRCVVSANYSGPANRDCRPSANLVASRPQQRRANFAFARTRSAELLSDAPEDFVGEPRILHGASQYYATDHRRCPKDRFFSVPAPRGKDFLKSLLQRDFYCRG